jgi:serine phosphatase RsbU (regulator of sigma subunit)
MKYFITLYFLLLFTVIHSQTHQKEIDSLSQLITTTDHDSTEVEAMLKMAFYMRQENPQQSLGVIQNAYTKSIASGDEYLRAACIESYGDHYSAKDEVDSSLHYYDEALTIFEELAPNRASKLCYKIGRIYFFASDAENSLKFWKKANKLLEPPYNPLSKATLLMAIGVVYDNIDSMEQAISYQNAALKIKYDNDLLEHVPISLNNMAELYRDLGNFDSAYALLDESKAISAEFDNIDQMIHADYQIGDFKYAQGKYDQAIPLFKTVLHYWEGINDKRKMLMVYEKLMLSYEGLNKFEEAFNYQNLYYEMQDSIYSEDQKNSLKEFEVKYQAKENKLLLENQELATEKAQQEKLAIAGQKRNQLYVFLGIFIVLALNAVYLFVLYNRKKRDQKLILEQKTQLEEKNTEITHSIEYAKQIQESILPDLKDLKNEFSDFFVLYKPKDIVAGDFYWFESTETHLFFAAADCTGHGVPGAMVSVLCSNSLDKIVHENHVTDPAEILNETRKLVIKSLGKGGTQMKDGMDISLCVFDKASKELKWAGANNPLWIKSEKDGEILEIKGDKQPIGEFVAAAPFTSHKVKLEANDTLYMFSDGYADQFGGDKGKKLKNKNFKQLILDTYGGSLLDQKNKLEEFFDDWKSDFEQLDDLCILSVKL